MFSILVYCITMLMCLLAQNSKYSWAGSDLWLYMKSHRINKGTINNSEEKMNACGRFHVKAPYAAMLAWKGVGRNSNDRNSIGNLDALLKKHIPIQYHGPDAPLSAFLFIYLFVFYCSFHVLQLSLSCQVCLAAK